MRIAGKLSGFLSKKYSGVFPGVNSSQRERILSIFSARISFPSLHNIRYLCQGTRDKQVTTDLVAGKTVSVSLAAVNLSPPTSRMTVLLILASSASRCLAPSTWRLSMMPTVGRTIRQPHYIHVCVLSSLYNSVVDKNQVNFFYHSLSLHPHHPSTGTVT